MVRQVIPIAEDEEIHRVDDATDLAIFVHGIGGHRTRSWGAFPQLIADDERFSKTDFLFFGYKTGLLRPFLPELRSVGARLNTILLDRQILLGRNSYHTVRITAHSMGGLIVKEAVAEALLSGQAHKLSGLQSVVFCSTPHLGEVKANLLQTLGLGGRHVRALKALSSQLLKTNKIWQTRVTGGEMERDIVHERYTARIAVKNIWGENDNIVTQANAFALSGEDDCHTVAGSHSSMIKPENHNDNRYTLLTRHLAVRRAHPESLPSERIMQRSGNLADSNLKIESTVEIPEKYERLCSKIEAIPV